MRILVTGANGLVGTKVLERLIDAELASEFHMLPEAPRPAPRVAGDGHLLVDDLAAWPVVSRPGHVIGPSKAADSCGLFLALKAGEMTAEYIGAVLAAGS